MISVRSKYYLKTLCYLCIAMLTVSCNNEQSLQEYYVDNKANSNYVMLDVPARFLSPDTSRLTEDQKSVLKTVQKVNILALPLSETTQKMYTEEKPKVQSILEQDGYDELMSLGKPSQRMRFYLKGETDAIDEVVVFALDDDKGFLLARILGEDMNIANMMRLAETMKNKDSTSNTLQFEGIFDIFEQD